MYMVCEGHRGEQNRNLDHIFGNHDSRGKNQQQKHIKEFLNT